MADRCYLPVGKELGLVLSDLCVGRLQPQDTRGAGQRYAERRLLWREGEDIAKTGEAKGQHHRQKKAT